MVKKYIHKNKGFGNLGVLDDAGISILVKPGEEIILSRKNEGNGLFIIEELSEKANKKTRKGIEEEKLNKEENKID